MIEDKFMKLLADPNKLKSNQSLIIYDHFKHQLESKFNCPISTNMYKHIIGFIEKEIIIMSVIDDIINQVMIHHNP